METSYIYIGSNLGVQILEGCYYSQPRFTERPDGGNSSIEVVRTERTIWPGSSSMSIRTVYLVVRTPSGLCLRWPFHPCSISKPALSVRTPFGPSPQWCFPLAVLWPFFVERPDGAVSKPCCSISSLSLASGRRPDACFSSSLFCVL